MSPDDDMPFSPFGRSPNTPFNSSGGEDFSSGAPEIAPHEIRRGKLLGKGFFAQVYAGTCRGLPVAVKVINGNRDELIGSRELEKFKEEIAVHQRLFHPNIVLMMGACTTGEQLMIVQELMHKDLERVLYDPDIHLSLARRIGFGREISLGMNWLHKLDPPVVHRDLKPSNCLLDREMQHLKIADFGLSSILMTDRSALKASAFTPRGTANYLAPEVLSGLELTTAADVYAFAIVLWQILTLNRPFEDIGPISMDSFTDFIVDDENRPTFEDSHREDYPMLVDLIEACWDAEPLKRPVFSEISDVISRCQVNLAIPHDPEAQKFWLKCFSTTNTTGLGVKIERVTRYLLKTLGEPTNAEVQRPHLKAQIKILEMLMMEHEDLSEVQDTLPPGKHRITAEWFGSLINWFGPLDKGFLSRMSDLCANPWFHGHLIGAHAQRVLTGRPKGVYLVRFSGTEPGYFTISYMLNGKVTHLRIVHKPCSREYSVGEGGRKYKSIQELLIQEKDALGLFTPCPG